MYAMVVKQGWLYVVGGSKALMTHISKYQAKRADDVSYRNQRYNTRMI